MVLMAVPMIVMYELSIIIARYVNPTTEVRAHELARDDEDDEPEADDEPGGSSKTPTTTRRTGTSGICRGGF